MCYHPITIPSNKRTYQIGVDNHYITIPCGECPDCQRRKANEWFVRIYAEFLQCRKNGGCVLMPTLTYNDENIPFFSTENGLTFRCFSKRHIQLFLKRLRSMLKQKFKYIVCAEYGKKNTKRPHYHMLLFFPQFINHFNALKAIKACWQYGFVGVSKKGLLVHSLAGCKYASKYVCKDFGFFDSMDLKGNYSLHDWLYNDLDFEDKGKFQGKLNLARKKALRQNGGQFHLQSLHFGFFLYDIMKSVCSSEKGYHMLLDKGCFILPQESSPYPIPKYLQRLEFMDFDKRYNQWIYNPVGIEHIKNTFEKRLNETRLQIENLKSLSYVLPCVPYDLRNEVNAMVKEFSNVDTKQFIHYLHLRTVDVPQALDAIQKGSDYKPLQYKIPDSQLREMHLSANELFSNFEPLKTGVSGYYRKLSNHLLTLTLTKIDYEDKITLPYPVKSFPFFKQFRQFKDFPQFADLEYYYSIYERLNMFVSEQKELAYSIKQSRKQQARDELNKLNYFIA